MVDDSGGRRTTAVEQHVVRRLAQRREQLDISRRTLDARIGARPGTIAMFERGARRLGADHLVFLAAVLEVDIDWFFEGVPNTRKVAFSLPPAKVVAEAWSLMKAFQSIPPDDVRRDAVGLVRALADGAATR